MLTRVIFAVLAAALMAAYLGAIVFKLKDPALAAVAVIGLALMAYDTVGSLREKD